MPTSEPVDPKKARTRGAILSNMRRREEKAAELLIERGWAVLSPYLAVTPISQANTTDLQTAIDQQNMAADMLRQSGWKVTSPYKQRANSSANEQ